MKRYRNMILIVVITLISLGTFYTKVATSESNLPNYYLKTIKGDANAANQIAISGFYETEGISKTLKITTNGNKYTNFNSIFNDIKQDRFVVQSLNNLQKEEKNFMRGKIDPVNFYKDNDFVWFVGINGIDQESRNRYELFIDGLDLKTNERNTFNIEIPTDENYAYIGIEDVQLVGKELKIVTRQNHPDQVGETVTDNTACYLYSINISQRKLIGHKEISSNTNNALNTITDLLPAKEIDSSKSSEYYMYYEIQNQQSTGEQITKEIGSSWHVINLNTGNEESINLSKEQSEQLNTSEFLKDGNKFYLLSHNDNGISVLTYNLKSKKVETEQEINVTKEENQQFVNIKVLNGKLYFLLIDNSSNSENHLYISNLDNGQIVYKGKVSVKNASKNERDSLNKLNIFDYNIQ